MIMKHIPVLLDAVMDTLGDIHGRTIVDCTFGAGGYSRRFLESGANVIAFDRDKNVVDDAKQLKSEYGERFRFINSAFSEIANLDSNEFDDVVFDFGISSMQIDNGERGFSFRFNGPLDMRMDKSIEYTAADLIKNLSVSELADILYKYGDVKKSHRVADILKKEQPQTTYELRDLIKNPREIAPLFQALRIAVNDEMGQIESALKTLRKNLRTGGRCVCVTFHSVEDRLVKNIFKQWISVAGDPRMPQVQNAEYKNLRVITPSNEELEKNPRARSAHLRAVEKL